MTETKSLSAADDVVTATAAAAAEYDAMVAAVQKAFDTAVAEASKVITRYDRTVHPNLLKARQEDADKLARSFLWLVDRKTFTVKLPWGVTVHVDPNRTEADQLADQLRTHPSVSRVTTGLCYKPENTWWINVFVDNDKDMEVLRAWVPKYKSVSYVCMRRSTL